MHSFHCFICFADFITHSTVTATVTETAEVTPTIYYDVTESRLILVTVTATDARVRGEFYF